MTSAVNPMPSNTLLSQAEIELEDRFYNAIRQCDLVTVEFLLNTEKNLPFEFQTKEIKNALFLACEQNHVPLVELVLKHPKLDLNSVNTQEQTCYTYAMDKNNMHVAMYLHDLPCFASTPLSQMFYYAVRNSNIHYVHLLKQKPEISQRLISRGVDRALIFIACGTGNVALVRELFPFVPKSRFTDVNHFGETVLRHAIKYHNDPVAELLAQLVGMPVTIKHSHGYAQLLLGENLPPRVFFPHEQFEKKTTLELACINGMFRTVTVLIQTGVFDVVATLEELKRNPVQTPTHAGMIDYLEQIVRLKK